ncbi:TrmB family transcriptional regulator [Myxococcus sp. CA051A]|uniref:TrmB family transcriptional regulator n=1 Tax=Myxococcus llanfairpwllgwyngyllgogerychwyrndrobwllllantysiliogogogochensis TaxID=2590453 RepID=A0A540X9Q7_9BACT|nr:MULTISPECIES: helix-turn-helix domain-containing protein [Myxococcus]NTX04479.1 TrmB family transcriptional regulator [Myxococcus sp. CA040A]NTX17047.1 TrmB family transcriptional regulator [Myxococcus sp. CA056]NTX63561.1 TrmB family transcriptional regulator [Myxococcus sp. CA051A]TQF17997.1 TrmB family transcriptional regulator [Myxococcus llanfairpwllgwyngyllgogerychwyrndrobwllllantysiliogogogochensis]
MNADEGLVALGFTEVEARVYCELLKGAPATGYRLAQALGKAPPSIYQALASLEHKGAVLVEEGEPRSFRPVPPDEVLAALQRGFETRSREAANALRKLHAPVQDDRIYHLKSTAQVMERARTMIAGATERLLFDLFPPPFASLTQALTEASSRRVAIAGLVYDETPKVPFDCVRSSEADFVRERWPGAQLTLVVDAREFLVALLTPDGTGVKQAIWSDSGYLSCLQHSGLSAEVRLNAPQSARARLARSFSLIASSPPGLRQLVGQTSSTSKRGDTP